MDANDRAAELLRSLVTPAELAEFLAHGQITVTTPHGEYQITHTRLYWRGTDNGGIERRNGLCVVFKGAHEWNDYPACDWLIMKYLLVKSDPACLWRTAELSAPIYRPAGF